MNRHDSSSDQMPHSCRFTRPAPSLGCSFFWGLGFLILGGGLWRIGPIVATGYNIWIPYGFGILLGLLGLATLWSCLYQLFLRSIPAATIELSGQPLRLGKKERLTVIQPGPVRLTFLRVTLSCIEQRTSMHLRNSRNPDGSRQSYRKTAETTLHTQTLFEISDLTAAGGDIWRQEKEFTIPTGSNPSRDGDQRSILWRLELSGKGRLLLKFGHPFEIQVT